jgi:hypothetical protein
MRGLLAGLLVAVTIATVALLAATLGSLGVAAIGWLLHRWFDLTQWQGSLIALAVTLGLSYLVFRLAVASPTPGTWSGEFDDWDEEDEDDKDDEPEDSGVVPWRRSRPTQADAPPAKREPTKRK